MLNRRSVHRNSVVKAAFALLICVLALQGAARAQDYPSRPIRIIDAYPPGGTSDVVARIIAQRLTENLRQQVVLDNRPGGNAVIGTNLAAKAPADGYTLLVFTSTLTIQPSLYKNLPYDVRKDFAPIALTYNITNVLVVNPSTPAGNLKDFIALVRAKPGMMSYGSGGTGTGTHLAMELLRSMADLRITHVPYKGIAPAVADIVGGHIDCAFATMSSVVTLIKAGKLRALAVATAQRSSALPEVPTADEAGVAGYVSPNAGGVLAPAKTPRAIVSRLNTEIVRILETKEIRERFTALGAEPVGGTPEQFRAFIASEIEKWARVVKASGMETQTW
jgi:tripartite-type tricarboxylate transporter receptor subunit TctC